MSKCKYVPFEETEVRKQINAFAAKYLETSRKIDARVKKWGRIIATVVAPPIALVLLHLRGMEIFGVFPLVCAALAGIAGFVSGGQLVYELVWKLHGSDYATKRQMSEIQLTAWQTATGLNDLARRLQKRGKSLSDENLITAQGNLRRVFGEIYVGLRAPTTPPRGYLAMTPAALQALTQHAEVICREMTLDELPVPSETKKAV